MPLDATTDTTDPNAPPPPPAIGVYPTSGPPQVLGPALAPPALSPAPVPSPAPIMPPAETAGSEDVPPPKQAIGQPPPTPQPAGTTDQLDLQTGGALAAPTPAPTPTPQEIIAQAPPPITLKGSAGSAGAIGEAELVDHQPRLSTPMGRYQDLKEHNPTLFEAINHVADDVHIPRTDLEALVYANSDYDPNARDGNRIGYMGLTPDDLQRYDPNGQMDPSNPINNLYIGAEKYRQLAQKYGRGTADVFAAYYAGEPNVDAAQRRPGADHQAALPHGTFDFVNRVVGRDTDTDTGGGFDNPPEQPSPTTQIPPVDPDQRNRAALAAAGSTIADLASHPAQNLGAVARAVVSGAQTAGQVRDTLAHQAVQAVTPVTSAIGQTASDVAQGVAQGFAGTPQQEADRRGVPVAQVIQERNAAAAANAPEQPSPVTQIPGATPPTPAPAGGGTLTAQGGVLSQPPTPPVPTKLPEPAPAPATPAAAAAQTAAAPAEDQPGVHLNPATAPKVPDGAARPFAPGEYVENPDGSQDGQQASVVKTADGRFMAVPSMWVKDGKPYTPGSQAELLQLAQASGLNFRTYDSAEEANGAIQNREAAGLKAQDTGRMPALWTGPTAGPGTNAPAVQGTGAPAPAPGTTGSGTAPAISTPGVSPYRAQPITQLSQQPSQITPQGVIRADVQGGPMGVLTYMSQAGRPGATVGQNWDHIQNLAAQAMALRGDPVAGMHAQEWIFRLQHQGAVQQLEQAYNHMAAGDLQGAAQALAASHAFANDGAAMGFQISNGQLIAQRFSEDTHQPLGQPFPINLDGLRNMMNITADPQKFYETVNQERTTNERITHDTAEEQYWHEMTEARKYVGDARANAIVQSHRDAEAAALERTNIVQRGLQDRQNQRLQATGQVVSDAYRRTVATDANNAYGNLSDLAGPDPQATLAQRTRMQQIYTALRTGDKNLSDLQAQYMTKGLHEGRFTLRPASDGRIYVNDDKGKPLTYLPNPNAVRSLLPPQNQAPQSRPATQVQ